VQFIDKVEDAIPAIRAALARVSRAQLEGVGLHGYP
jgi:hypothetical protein